MDHKRSDGKKSDEELCGDVRNKKKKEKSNKKEWNKSSEGIKTHISNITCTITKDFLVSLRSRSVSLHVNYKVRLLSICCERIRARKLIASKYSHAGIGTHNSKRNFWDLVIFGKRQQRRGKKVKKKFSRKKRNSHKKNKTIRKKSLSWTPEKKIVLNELCL